MPTYSSAVRTTVPGRDQKISVSVMDHKVSPQLVGRLQRNASGGGGKGGEPTETLCATERKDG